MRTVTACALAILVASSSVRAEMSARSLARAVREEAARQAASAPASRGAMSPALKWTGIGMLIGGGVMLASGVLVDNACIENGDHDQSFCDDLQTAWFATGGAIAAGGGVLLLVGHGKRQSSPALTFGPKRVAWRIRF